MGWWGKGREAEIAKVMKGDEKRKGGKVFPPPQFFFLGKDTVML